ncbi:MAG: phenylalanine--tRNA ligase subunit beta [Proteobacteria bacterium]|nr:phenylalanine--tRNA ligase subunit beta [Pseudomonadota bacterium]
MQFSQNWLQALLGKVISTETLVSELTMAGIEVGSVKSASGEFSKVVIGQVEAVEPHPEADRLKLCTVNIGSEPLLKIVCGAKNVQPTMKVAVALIGAKLPNNIEIKKAKLRGVTSEGMLCSTSELGLTETSEGIMSLPSDAPLGKDLHEYFDLPDQILELEITPNRGDCLSITGTAREVALLLRLDWHALKIESVSAVLSEQLPIEISAPEYCSHYMGRVIRQINSAVESPIWLQEKLRRSGIRTIHPVVDVTNYVMLELGQPLHAFDLKKIEEKITVRLAKKGETLETLDGTTITLDEKSLVIADSKKALALAGVMGGKASGVTLETMDIFLESAFFAPEKIIGKARQYGLQTDSSYRYERGVSPELQSIALERVTQLVLEICGGKPGPVIEKTAEEYLPKQKLVSLRHSRLKRILGLDIPEEQVEDILKRLGMEVYKQGEQWEVHVPLYRFDISIEEDLIEEVIRVFGYNNLPTELPTEKFHISSLSETKIDHRQLQRVLIDRGYHEVINYSFIDPKTHALLYPEQASLSLSNPISAELSVMRTSLWGDLLSTVLYNRNRQQERLRLFESGLVFLPESNGLKQIPMLAGIVVGNVDPKQWGTKARDADFYDVKADIEALLDITHQAENFEFVAAENSALHPGRSAKIILNEKVVGWIGALHPRIEQALDLNQPVWVFELNLTILNQVFLPQFKAISKYPAISRDISFLIDEKICFSKIKDAIRQGDNSILQSIQLFDVYQGKGVEPGKKSLAISFTLQHPDRTLVDTEVSDWMSHVIQRLKQSFDIVLREGP